MNTFNASSPIHSENEDFGYSKGYFDTGSGEGLDVTVHIPEGNKCSNCGEEVNETVDGWVHNHSDSSYCNEDDDVSGLEDDEKSLFLTDEGYWTDETQTLESALGDWVGDHEQATPEAKAPGNWVGFTLKPQSRETQVQISVGDPRGCFQFTLWTAKNPDTGEEELRMTLPHPGGLFPHMTLTHLHDGTYRVE